ncbi:MAG: hypothetical protein JSV66_01300 [Trueperaceae bacterium]|nr:MAG: hypothetical protein JSV66_01300 [Trueperaceae bacterium]
MARRRKPAPPLPEALRQESPTAKLLYLWLLPQGEVSYSQRAMAEALGTTQPAIKQAMKRLRAIGFIEDSGEVRERATARFSAVAMVHH